MGTFLHFPAAHREELRTQGREGLPAALSKQQINKIIRNGGPVNSTRAKGFYG